MELNIERFIILFLLLSLAGVAYALYNEKRKSLVILKKLDDLQGVKEEDLFGKAKYSELGLMCAGIAHEISNPLSIISGRALQMSRIYKDPEKAQEIAKGIDQIQINTQRIAKVIQGIRDYLYKDDQLVENDISLKELFDGVDVFFRQRLQNHGIELRMSNLERTFVRGHRGQLELVILNLINNSFDAVDKLAEKWIEVEAIKERDSVSITFRDSGRGIPIQIVKHMMDPFYSTKKSKGSGLGLPFIKSVIQKHGGRLWYVDNSPNTTFKLELPTSRFQTSY